MNVDRCVENFSRAVKKNIHDHFEIQSASEGQFRQAGDKEDRQNAFGCMLPFRMIRYARNCRAPVGVHARARGRVVCTVRDAPRAWPSSVHESVRLCIYDGHAYCYEAETENCTISVYVRFSMLCEKRNI